MDTLVTWKALALLLYPADRALTEELFLAINEPEAYFEEYAEELRQRGFDSAADVSPWLALVDGLERRRALVEVDWKCPGEDLAFHLSRLAISVQQKLNWSTIESDKRPTEHLLSAAAREVAPRGLALVCLDIDSDSYPLTIIPAQSVAETCKLAKQLHHIVKSWV